MEGEAIQGFTKLRAESWHCRVRINVAKTATRGYTHETTVELGWGELTDFSPTDPDPSDVLRHLLRASDGLAREEIARRESLDAGDGA